MERRKWIKYSSAGVAAAYLPLLILSCQEGEPAEPADFLSRLISVNDDLIEELLERQVTDNQDTDHGGFLNQHKIALRGTSGWAINRLGAGYVLENSKFHHSPLVLEALDIAIDFLLRKQHSDGTIDLLTTNFHSTPDVAFIVEPIALAYPIMLQRSDAALKPALDKIKQFLLRCGEALAVGGIHTPNHRWVVCMALARLNQLFPNPAYLERIETWLREKIDIDPDGQFTERSTGVYSPLCDRWLITIARILGKDDLFEPVRRNLEMTLYHEHPNGEIATEASRRQDQYLARNFAPYYYSYLYMAHHDQNGAFGAMAVKIQQDIPIRSLSLNLLFLIEDESLLRPPPISEIPDHYVKHFPHSQMVRIRRGRVDASILAKNSAFFTFQKGNAVLQATRLASAFFGKGQFVAEKLEVRGGEYRLTQDWEGPYYQPYPVDSLPDTGNWEEMPRKNRPQSEVQKLHAEIIISETDGSFAIDIALTGTDFVPVALELAFRKGGVLNQTRKLPQEPDSHLPLETDFSYRVGDDQINVQGFDSQHEYTQLRGAEAKIDAESVYFTGYTPFRRQITIA